MNCPFCRPSAERIAAENELALALWDLFSVNSRHALIVPRRHVASWFASTRVEQNALLDLADGMKARLDRDCRPVGYNLGINVGEAAGQTVPHLYLHVIPRYAGDKESPRCNNYSSNF